MVLTAEKVEERKEKKTKPRELYEISKEAKDEVGIQPYYEGNMEPTGVNCVSYLKQGSPNHKLMKKLAAVTKEEDEELFDLHLPMAGAFGWLGSETPFGFKETEEIHMVKRVYANVLWDSVDEDKGNPKNTSHLDPEPTIYKGIPGKPWKEKVVRRWLLENGYPTLNYRLHGYNSAKNPFPWDKYFGKSNRGGVGLLIADIGKEWDFEPQFRMARYIRPYMDRLSKEKNIHFTVLEKSAATLTIRQGMKVGLNKSLDLEFVLMENAGKSDEAVDNYRHGNPKKYRLTNLADEAHVKQWFEDYWAGKLPTYWASLEEGQKKKKVKRNGNHHLSSWNFEEFVYNTDQNSGVLVAFFNDDPKHECEHCVRGREVWDSLAKEMELKKKEFKHMILASLDQSANEHGETLVPGKMAGPMVVWYPPSKTGEQRRKSKQIMHSWSTPPSAFEKDVILEKIRDLVEQLNDEREEL